MKNPVLIVTLLGLISFGASAAQYNHHDDNGNDRHANELRLKTFEGETSYQVKVNPRLLVDRDEPVSTLHATELRKLALDEPVRNDVTSFTPRDRDEPLSTQHATELRKQALDNA